MTCKTAVGQRVGSSYMGQLEQVKKLSDIPQEILQSMQTQFNQGLKLCEEREFRISVCSLTLVFSAPMIYFSRSLLPAHCLTRILQGVFAITTVASFFLLKMTRSQVNQKAIEIRTSDTRDTNLAVELLTNGLFKPKGFWPNHLLKWAQPIVHRSKHGYPSPLALCIGESDILSAKLMCVAYLIRGQQEQLEEDLSNALIYASVQPKQKRPESKTQEQLISARGDAVEVEKPCSDFDQLIEWGAQVNEKNFLELLIEGTKHDKKRGFEKSCSIQKK